MVAKDFSPPDNVFASRPLPATFVGSGSTWMVTLQYLWGYQKRAVRCVLTTRSSFFSLWLASSLPRKLRSLNIHMNWTRALAVIARWKSFQRPLRFTKVILSSCELNQSHHLDLATMYHT